MAGGSGVVALAVTLTVVAVGGGLFVGGGVASTDGGGDDPAPTSQVVDIPAAPVGGAAREVAGRRLVGALERGWDYPRRVFAASVADSAPGRQAASALRRNLRDLQVRDLALTWRRPAQPPAAAPADVAVGIVQVAWSQPRWQQPATTLVGLVYTVDDTSNKPAGRLLRIEAARGRAAPPTPLWAMGRLQVDATGMAQVVALPGTVRRMPRLTARLPAVVRRSHREVSKLLGPDRDRLLVVLPATRVQYRAVLGRDGVPGSRLAAAAAVTSAVGPQVGVDGAMHIVINPATADRLRPAALRVLVRHEITHAFTGTPAVPIPLWVAEGFADFAALSDGRFPSRLLASEAIRRTRQTGPPADLPTDHDFAAAPARVRAAYEQSWLAFRAIEEVAGKAATVRFYRAVTNGRSVDHALLEHTSLSLQQLTARWRADLRGLARVDG